MRKGFTLVGVMIVVAIVGIVLWMATSMGPCAGVGGCGPTRTVSGVKVNRLYVDTNGKKSFYMVGTDKGVFEVDNGILLRMWNADEVYSSLQQGRTYDFVTKGNTVKNWFMQEYPRIVKAAEVKP